MGDSPFVTPAGAARFKNESGESQIMRIGTSLQKSDDGGVTFGAFGGGFGADTIVQLANSAPANVNAWEQQITLTNNTPSSEASKVVTRLLKAGVQSGPDTYTLDPDNITLNSVTAKLNLFSDHYVIRDSTLAALGLGSNQGDVVQGHNVGSNMPTNQQFGFMQITQMAGVPTGVPNRLATAHTAMVYDATNARCFFRNTTTGVWAADGDNMKLQATLTNADITRDISTGSEAVLPPATLTGAHILTLAVAGAITGDIIRVTRYDSTANTYTVKDDAATTLLTMAVSVRQCADFLFNGTHFVLHKRWFLN